MTPNHRELLLRDPSVKMVTNPVRLSGTPIIDYTAPPTLGQHNGEILGELLGMSEVDIEALRQRKVI